MTALLFDLDGVFYVGEQAIPGASGTLSWVRDQNIPHLFLTNTTSRPRTDLVQKLARIGIKAHPDNILTPPVAAVRWIASHVDGPSMLFVPDATRVEFAALELCRPDSVTSPGAVVIGDLGEAWDYATYNAAFRALMQNTNSALVALGMTRYWKAPDGLRLDVGAFVSGLEYATGRRAIVLGKPSPDFFQAALEMLGVDRAEAIMVGDDIRGDIGAAQSAGIRGLLVQTGKFRQPDLEDEIVPAGVLTSIASLRDWIESNA